MYNFCYIQLYNSIFGKHYQDWICIVTRFLRWNIAQAVGRRTSDFPRAQCYKIWRNRAGGRAWEGLLAGPHIYSAGPKVLNKYFIYSRFL